MNRLVSFLILIVAFSAAGEKTGATVELSAQDFLQRVRKPPGRECWAMMDGYVQHRRRGKKTIKTSLYLGIRFTPESTLAQVVIDNKEGYNIRQEYSASKDSTAIIPLSHIPPEKSVFAKFGITPQDMTMSFLFWTFSKELPPDTVKGYECRVFKLISPDKKEFVFVHISKKYFFPLKVQWFKSDKTEKPKFTNSLKPYRTLEVEAFKKQDDFWLVSSLQLYGPGWRSRVKFDKTRAGYTKDAIPGKLFRFLPRNIKNKTIKLK